MSLLRCQDMTDNFLSFESTSLSLYAFSGMEYKETSVGFIFLNIPRLGKRQYMVLATPLSHIPFIFDMHRLLNCMEVIVLPTP